MQKNIHVDYWFNQVTNKRAIYFEQIPTPQIKNSRYPYKYIRRLMNPTKLHDFPVDLFKPVDVFHGGNFITYKTKKAKNVITIHDLAFLKFSNIANDHTYRHHTLWLPYSIEKADHIIAVSQQTKQDIIEYYKVPESKITVTYLAADHHIKTEDDTTVNIIKAKYALPEQYVLYVGTIEPRKNIPFLIEGYALAKKQYKFEHKLLLVGGKGWKDEPVYQMINKYSLKDDVIFSGYVDEEDLPAIYTGASLFLFPSVYEGFGIPVLEAMQCKVPVITSNVSSLPEIVGEAGRLVSLKQRDDFIDSIGELLGDEKKRKQYAEAGAKQAQQFSWNKTALQTLEVYRKLLK